MTWEELNSILNTNYNRYKDSWEQTRWIGYINACIAGSSIKKPQDLVKFSWEEVEVTELSGKSVEERKQDLFDFVSSLKTKNNSI